MEYEAPKIKKIVELRPEQDILAGSVVEKAEVTSMGQEVVEYDFSSDEFNQEWEWE